MTASFTADAILFAINSAIKLGRNTQRAYAKSIKAKAIVLPLPKFDGIPNSNRAHEFFSDQSDRTGGHQFVGKLKHLEDLFDKFDVRGLKPAEEQDYIEYYRYFQEMLRKETGEGLEDQFINTGELVDLLRIRQWEKGKTPKTSPLQYVAGTLVEIGIDYFNQVPGALNVNSAFGKSMRSFLTAMDDIPFSDSDEFKKAAELIVPKLFITAAEIIGNLSVEISKDEKIQAFMQTTCRHLSADVFKLVQDRRQGNQEEVVQWGQLILHSMVKNAGTYVFNSPADLLHTNSGVSQLIKETGGVLLDIILQDPHKINIQAGFNIDALDRMVKASLTAIAEHPEMVDGREGFREIISGVSLSLAESNIRRPDLLPELVRLIMQHTAGNLHLIWKTPEESGENLLVITVKTLLDSLAQPMADEAHWMPRLGRQQLMTMADYLLEEVVSNPAWIRSQVNDKPVLREVLDTTFAALLTIPKDSRINAGVLQMLLKLNIRTVATSPGVLNRLALGGGTAEKTYLNKALDLVFTFVFENERVEGPERIGLLMDLTEFALGAVLANHPNSQGLQLLDLVLFKDPDVDFTRGFDKALANELIDAALAVTHEYPALVSKNISLQPIIGGVAGALQASSFRQPGLLPELVRLVLENTALNTQLILKAETGEPEYLLAVVLRRLLQGLSVKPDAGHWQPQLTTGQALDITENIFNEIVDNPRLVIPAKAEEPSVFEVVLDGVFSALQQIPAAGRFSGDHLEWVIRHSLRNVAANRVILSKVKWGGGNTEVVIFNKSLDIVFNYAFAGGEGEERAMRQEDLESLLEFVMGKLMVTHPDKTGLVLLDLILFKDDQLDVRRYFDQDAAASLTEIALRVFAVRPELVVRDEIVRKLLQDTATALRASRLESPDLLPEVFRLLLLHLAENTELIRSLDAGRPKSILTDTVAQVLRAIAAKPRRGKWKPSLGRGELIELLDSVVEEVVRNPNWMDDDEIIAKTLDAVFRGMEAIPKDKKLPFVTIRTLIESSVMAVARRKQLVEVTLGGRENEQELALTYALTSLFASLYDEEKQSSGAWTLTQTDTVNDIIAAYLNGVAEGPVTKEKIDEKCKQVQEAVVVLDNNAVFSLDNLLVELEQ